MQAQLVLFLTRSRAYLGYESHDSQSVVYAERAKSCFLPSYQLSKSIEEGCVGVGKV